MDDALLDLDARLARVLRDLEAIQGHPELRAGDQKALQGARGAIGFVRARHEKRAARIDYRMLQTPLGDR